MTGLHVLTPSQKLRVSNPSEPKLWIFPKGLLRGLGRIILACVLVTLLFVPVVLINRTNNMRSRFMLIWISATLFIIVLTVGTKAKTSEVFVAGTT
jgi:hypothetical protein